MLHLVGCYRLLKPTVAVERTEDEKKCFQVPEGSTLLVNSFQREDPLVSVVYNGRRLLMFEDDLAQRTQPVEGLGFSHRLAHFSYPWHGT
jgi:hypothetical protein